MGYTNTQSEFKIARSGFPKPSVRRWWRERICRVQIAIDEGAHEIFTILHSTGDKVMVNDFGL